MFGDNTIHVSSMQRITQAMVRQMTSAAGTGSFAQALQRQASAQSAADLERYRNAIETRISAMHIDTTRIQDDLYIDISAEGWQRMQTDPAYEAWVLDVIQEALATPDPFASVSNGRVTHLRFGAAPEEFRGDSAQKGSGDLGEFTGMSKKKSYWEERQERIDRDRELNEKIADARARARAVREIKRIRGEATTGTDDAAAAADILTILLASYMQST